MFLTSLSCAQWSTSPSPFRVVTVSPNYPNIYPRYSTLQGVWAGIKDSAKVSTGKYFTVNVTTNYRNISDWTSTYKDSILNRAPYMWFAAFGQAINDSIIGVTTSEFTLAGGILGINPLTAGDGLSYSSNMYKVNVKNPILMSNDTVYFRFEATNFTLVGGTFTWYKTTNSGIQSTANGFQVLPRQPLRVSGDTTLIAFASEFSSTTDSLRLNFDPNAFYTLPAVSPSFYFRADSGLTIPLTATGVKVAPDWNTITFNSSKKLTINTAIWGNGLAMYSNVAQVNVAEPLTITNDTINLGYLEQHFGLVASGLYLKVDSGLVANTFPVPSTPKVSLDWVTLIFTATKALQVNPLIAGSGLLMTAGIINILYNDYAKVENDTLKIRPSTTLLYHYDSIKATVGYANEEDSLGYGFPADGKIKRYAITYVTLVGNDTCIYANANIAISRGEKVTVYWSALAGGFIIRKNRSTDLLTVVPNDFTTPYLRRINISLEVYTEAQ